VAPKTAVILSGTVFLNWAEQSGLKRCTCIPEATAKNIILLHKPVKGG